MTTLDRRKFLKKAAATLGSLAFVPFLPGLPKIKKPTATFEAKRLEVIVSAIDNFTPALKKLTREMDDTAGAFGHPDNALATFEEKHNMGETGP